MIGQSLARLIPARFLGAHDEHLAQFERTWSSV